MSTPTQVQRPWRATFRTTLAATWGLLPLLPLMADAANIDTVPAVASVLGITAAITRVTALPAVDMWLQTWLPMFAAGPHQPTTKEPQ